MAATTVHRPRRDDGTARGEHVALVYVLEGTLQGDPEHPGRATYGQRGYVIDTNPHLRYIPAGRRY